MQLFQMHFNGLLKDGKPGKHLKQSFFMSLQGLSEEEKNKLLEKTIDGKHTIKEAEKRSWFLKQLKDVKTKITEVVKTLTWEETVRHFPQHTNETALKPKTIGEKRYAARAKGTCI